MALATPFHHGLRLKIEKDQAPPIRVLASGIILLVGTSPIGPVNEATLVLGNRANAVALFGAFRPWHVGAGFTIPEALEGILDQGNAPIVVINVADPDDFTLTEEEMENAAFDRRGVLKLTHEQLGEDHALAISTTGTILRYLPSTGALTIQLPIGLTSVTAVLDSNDAAVTSSYNAGTGLLTVTAGATFGSKLRLTLTGTWSPTTDYTLDTVAGTITRLSTGRMLPEMIMTTVTYNYSLYDLQANSEKFIGVVNPDSSRTGLKLGEAVPAKIGIIPRLIICPRATDRASEVRHLASPIVQAMDNCAKVLGARAIVSSEDAMSLTEFTLDCSHYADPDSRIGVLAWPYVKVSDPDGNLLAQPACARIAGQQVVVDNSEGFHESFSNRKLQGVLDVTKHITHSYTEVVSDSNFANERGGTVIVNEQGYYKAHGVWQPNGEMLSVLRTADMINNSILLSQRWVLDKAVGKERVRQVLQRVKSLFRQLEAEGVLIKNPNPSQFPDCWLDPELNSPDALALGKISFSYRFNPPPLMTDVTFIAHITRDYLEGFVKTLNAA